MVVWVVGEVCRGGVLAWRVSLGAAFAMPERAPARSTVGFPVVVTGSATPAAPKAPTRSHLRPETGHQRERVADNRPPTRPTHQPRLAVNTTPPSPIRGGGAHSFASTPRNPGTSRQPRPTRQPEPATDPNPRTAAQTHAPARAGRQRFAAALARRGPNQRLAGHPERGRGERHYHAADGALAQPGAIAQRPGRRHGRSRVPHRGPADRDRAQARA